jgi:hypothetical protein
MFTISCFKVNVTSCKLDISVFINILLTCTLTSWFRSVFSVNISGPFKCTPCSIIISQHCIQLNISSEARLNSSLQALLTSCVGLYGFLAIKYLLNYMVCQSFHFKINIESPNHRLCIFSCESEYYSCHDITLLEVSVMIFVLSVLVFNQQILPLCLY